MILKIQYICPFPARHIVHLRYIITGYLWLLNLSIYQSTFLLNDQCVTHHDKTHIFIFYLWNHLTEQIYVTLWKSYDYDVCYIRNLSRTTFRDTQLFLCIVLWTELTFQIHYRFNLSNIQNLYSDHLGWRYTLSKHL